MCSSENRAGCSIPCEGLYADATSGRVGARFRQREPVADSAGEAVCDFLIPRDGFAMAGLAILPEGMMAALAAQDAAVATEMAEERFVFQSSTNVCRSAVAGVERNVSSLRCSRIIEMDSRKFSRQVSRDMPWPLAPGSSAQ